MEFFQKLKISGKIKTRHYIVLQGLLFLFILSVFAQKADENKPTEIIILHVNDMHSKIDNMAKLAYLADSLRKTHPWVFLVSAGDNFTGNPVVDKVKDKGYPMIDLMNQCGFNVSAIGNHEFELGQKLMNKRFNEARFPFICCNINTAGAVLKQPEPYVILNAGNDIHLAFLGMIETNVIDGKEIPETHISNVKGINFPVGIEKAKEYAWLKDTCGILIGLSHLGRESDSLLAREVPGFTVIIGGHSHAKIDSPPVINGVMITQAGSNLMWVGKIILKIQNGRVIFRNDEIIPMDSIPRSDQKIEASIKRYNNNKKFNRVLGIAGDDLKGYDELGCLMTDALTSALSVNFAFQNVGGIRIYSLPKGNITLKDIYQLDPFDDPIITYKMNFNQIRDLICNSFNDQRQVDLMVSGMTYRIIADDKNHCLDVKMFDQSGLPVDTTKEYSVAMNNYIPEFYHVDHNGPGTIASRTSTKILIEYIRKVKTVNYKGIRRTSMESR